VTTAIVHPNEAGGRLFEVSKREPIDKIFNAIAEDLRNQYNIGYTPPADDATSYHRIHLAANEKEMVVQARDGYYAAK
jgi:VWFA-related protein